MSPRETIMQFLKAELDGIGAGVDVYRSRLVPVTRTANKALLLYWSRDQIIEATVGNTLIRQLTVHTDIIARGALPDSLADATVVAAHAIVMADPTCNGASGDIEEIDMRAELESADQDAAIVRRAYVVKYVSAKNADT